MKVHLETIKIYYKYFKPIDVSESNFNRLTFFSTKYTLPRFEYDKVSIFSVVESCGSGANDDDFNECQVVCNT